MKAFSKNSIFKLYLGHFLGFRRGLRPDLGVSGAILTWFCRFSGVSGAILRVQKGSEDLIWGSRGPFWPGFGGFWGLGIHSRGSGGVWGPYLGVSRAILAWFWRFSWGLGGHFSWLGRVWVPDLGVLGAISGFGRVWVPDLGVSGAISGFGRVWGPDFGVSGAILEIWEGLRTWWGPGFGVLGVGGHFWDRGGYEDLIWGVQLTILGLKGSEDLSWET